MAKVDEIKFWQGTQEQYNNGELSGNFYDWMNASTLDSVYTDTDTPTTSSKVYSEPFVESSLTITGIEKGLGTAVAMTLPISASWQSITYVNDKFIAVIWDSDIFVYSTDGINWTQGTLPSTQNWVSVTYGNGLFVAVAYNTDVFAYSTDGINWTQGTLPSSQNWRLITYGNGMFVAVVSSPPSAVYAYSTDGINWTQGSLPSRQYWYSVAYGNGKFVAISDTTYSSGVFAYSTDGINWTQGDLPVYGVWRSITYGDGKFVAVADNSREYVYSSDGVNWTRGYILGGINHWQCITYGNGMFVAVSGTYQFSSMVSAYSTDGINWTQGTLPSTQYWRSITYGNGKFVAVVGSSNKAAYIPVSNSLTLSDTNSYNRNQAGDEEIQTNVGQDHPDYVCYINEVGIKIADKFIARKDNA